MDYLYFVISAIIAIPVIVLVIFFHLKKRSVIKKIDALTTPEKNLILDTLAEPVGYNYDSCQDIFATRHDAPQKLFGYTTLYDLSAPFFNMIFDYETIYFNYKSRTWLIEIWKGQYGINTGCELGIYYADRILKPEEYDFTLFKAVDSKDMLDISLKLNSHSSKEPYRYTKLAHMRDKHWWLTGFKVGLFTKPHRLFVNTAITFKDYSMMRSFLESFKATMPDTSYKTSGLTVYFTFYKSNRRYSFFKRAVRSIALLSCRAYCKLFNFVTKPFFKSGDKLLYLYYLLPFAAKRIFKVKHRK